MLPFSKHWYWFLSSLCLLAVLWELPVFHYPFFADDPKLMQELRPLQLPDIATYLSPNWGWVYRPFMLIYWASMMRLFGPTPTVLPFHVVSVLLHSGTSVLLGLLCYRVLDARDQGKRGLYALGCGTAFFFWTGQSETVLIASNASVLFCTFFSLCALHAFWAWRTKEKRVAAIFCLSFLVLALGFKEEAVVVPLLCAVLDVCFLGRTPRTPRLSRFYAGTIAVLCAFAVLSVFAQASIDTVHPKIVTVPRHVSLLSVADFILALTGNVASTPFSLVNFLVVGALGALLLRCKAVPVRGAFLVVALACIPIPLMTGEYSLIIERFFYFPRALFFLAVAVLFCLTRFRAVRALPFATAAVMAGGAREVLSFLADQSPDSPFVALQDELLRGDVFVPCALIGTVLLALAFWKAGLLDTPVAGAVVIVATLAQANVWGTLPAFGQGCALAAMAVCALLFNQTNKGQWAEGVLVAAALWRLPALTLPLMVAFALLRQQRFVSRPVFTSLPLRTSKEHHAHL